MDPGKYDFAAFEHEGWQRVAGGFDATWGGLTRLFVLHLLSAVGAQAKDRILDVACGTGYVAEAARRLGADPIGVDFSAEMIRIARQRNPEIEFREGDAQDLEFTDGSFDAAVMNFGVLHLSDPERAFAEAQRVLRPGGRYGFTVWAGPEHSPGARLVEEVFEAHADPNVDLPEGPDFYAYSQVEACRESLSRAGFDPKSFRFRTETMEWILPTASFLFEAERDHGVRATAFLAAQTDEALQAIEAEMERRVAQFETDDGYAIPYAAHIVTAVRPRG